MATFFDKVLARFGAERIKEKIVEPVTKDHRAGLMFHHDHAPEDLPHFRLHHAVRMQADPVVKFGLNIRDALISPADVDFETNNPKLGKWLRKQWDVIWGKNWRKITQAKQWGYQGLEVLMDLNETTGYVDVIGLKDFAPFDGRPLRSEGETVGLKVRGNTRAQQGPLSNPEILMPQALWVTFGSRWGNPYGRSIFRGAFSPWWEKWMTGGVKKVTQLRMLKDAYRGMIGWYPLFEKHTTPGGQEISWRDLIRELLENVNAGGSISLPLAYDNEGRKKFDITDQPQAPDPKAIFEWASKTDRDIWFAMDIPGEIIEAASPGSGFSGRSIPFVVALQLIGGDEFSGYAEAIERMVLRPLAQLNFGNQAADYTMKPKSLPEIYAEMLGGSQIGGGAIGGQPGQVAGSPQPAIEDASQPQPAAQPEETSTPRQPAQPKQPEGGTLFDRLPPDKQREVLTELKKLSNA